MYPSAMFLWLYFSPLFMLTKKEVEDFQKRVKKEFGYEITYEDATELGNNFCAFMILLLFPPNQQYPRLLINPPKTDLD